MAERMVPSPRHERLRQLLVEAEERAHEVRQAYQRALGAMQSGKVWTGPTATTWVTELGERHQRLGRLAQRVVDAVEEELRRHPPLVTEAEANAMRRDMAGRT
ncbi:hypothetical protein GCM10022252_19070 [Streptosporangium oxazolinicum]|uniref:WXG100 family type VII secretion target n=1 Tax=Streptosporangium oxazolinicum TaxID=909287 RepID=A0ABP8AN27_9ACTN